MQNVGKFHIIIAAIAGCSCHCHKVRQLLELELCSWLSEVNSVAVNLVLTCRQYCR